jgi:hypothetical protein
MFKNERTFMTTSHRMRVSTGVFKAGVALAAFTLLGNGIALADTIAYISNTVGENIQAWDVTTNTLNTVVTSIGGNGASGEIDSLMFVNPTTVVYSIIGDNAIGIFTCSAFATNEPVVACHPTTFSTSALTISICLRTLPRIQAVPPSW